PPAINSYSLGNAEGLALRMTRRPGGELRLDLIAHEHPLFGGAEWEPDTKITPEALRAVAELAIDENRFVPIGLRYPESEPVRNGVDWMLRTGAGLLRDSLAPLRYLGPLRAYPPRHILLGRRGDPSRGPDDVTWAELRRNSVLRARVNEWLNSPE